LERCWRISPGLRDQIISEYLLFLLILKTDAFVEIYGNFFAEHIDGLGDWLALFLKDIKERSWPYGSTERASLESAFESLDDGKLYVSEGYDWLREELLGD
jgi:hypothetical protein